MKPQIIVVNTKGGLIAAFRCAGFTEAGINQLNLPMTHITLRRKTGFTEFKLYPAYCPGHKKSLKKAIAKIRKIPSKDLLA